MRPLLSVQQMRLAEDRLIEQGVPSLILMENAGRAAAHLVGLRLRPRAEGLSRKSAIRGSCVRCADERALDAAHFLILCGLGNNGGDGFVVARHLRARGASVQVLGLAPFEQLKGDGAIMARAWLAVGGSYELATSEKIRAFREGLQIDALLGTGLSRPLEGALAELVQAMNENPTPIVALDIPSGLDAERGVVHEGVLGKVAVRAEHTICFGALKSGLLTTDGHAFGGRITLSGLGVPPFAEENPRAWLGEDDDLRAWLTPRSRIAHKGVAGHVAVVGGSSRMVGAAHLCARAALRAGAGVATIHTTAEARRELEAEVLEVMTCSYERGQEEMVRAALGQAQAVALGPGWGRGEAAVALFRALFAVLPVEGWLPTSGGVVLDADALRLAVGHLEWLRAASAEGACLFLTPHPGEAAELLGLSIGAVEADRFAAVTRLAELTGATVVLKGSRTIVASPGRAPFVSAWGSPCLATAGAGDVLTGILVGLLTQRARSGLEKRLADAELALLAVGLHGKAGELFEAERGDSGCLASDIVELVPRVRTSLLEE